MLPIFAFLLLSHTLPLPAQAQVTIPFDQYLTGLGDALKANGMSFLSNVIGSVNGSESGAALLEALYRGSGYTLFGPVDAVSCPTHLISDAVMTS
jgi:hypothetical protein